MEIWAGTFLIVPSYSVLIRSHAFCVNTQYTNRNIFMIEITLFFNFIYLISFYPKRALIQIFHYDLKILVVDK